MDGLRQRLREAASEFVSALGHGALQLRLRGIEPAEGARDDGIEGLMLKRRDSLYVAGRPKGPWFKWKRDPFNIDAVLMYAQRGHGKRSSFYSDYTFGVWRGEGVGHGLGDDGDDLRYAEQIIVSHDGQNYLNWQTRSWSIDNRGEFIAPLFRETGYWRISEDDSIELLIAHAEGYVELLYGKPLAQTAWEVATDALVSSATATKLHGAKRLYGIAEDGSFAYVEERLVDGELAPRLSAKLDRYAG